ncbi:helix-turn-helix domain-containing protein [Streptomyces sp. ISL-90]|nr:helix-turn-helix domain-containing protein [Streptomyces sp. ISL-90]
MISIGKAAELLGIPVHTVRRLADSGILRSHHTEGGHRRFRRGELQDDYRAHDPEWAPRATFDAVYPLNGLAEDIVWRELDHALNLSENARRIAGYTVTEMVNNAIDHSEGTEVRVASRDDDRITVSITDDGVGVFENMRRKLDLPDLFASIQELSKGRRTTDPSRHSGEGIFFSSKAVPRFSIEANGLIWTVDNDLDDIAVGTSDVQGTRVRLELERATDLTLRELFGRFTDDDGAFTRTRPVVKLFELGTEFISRSEAKRLTAGLERFTEVELDFQGVDVVGQGFIDEVFRVWAGENPGTELLPTRMNDAVEFMVRRGLPR